MCVDVSIDMSTDTWRCVYRHVRRHVVAKPGHPKWHGRPNAHELIAAPTPIPINTEAHACMHTRTHTPVHALLHSWHGTARHGTAWHGTARHPCTRTHAHKRAHTRTLRRVRAHTHACMHSLQATNTDPLERTRSYSCTLLYTHDATHVHTPASTRWARRFSSQSIHKIQ